MTEIEPYKQSEVAVIPVGDGLALFVGESDNLPAGERVMPRLLDAALGAGGMLGGGFAATSLLDGSLVRLAPETLAALKEGAAFGVDANTGALLGQLRGANGRIKHVVRLVEGAANPVAAGLIAQSMTVQKQLADIRAALEQIDAKLDVLLAAAQIDDLARLRSAALSVQEMSQKVHEGVPLSAVDENKLRDYEDLAAERRIAAEEWLRGLRSVLADEAGRVKSHAEALELALGDHTVVHWVRILVMANIVYAQTRWLRSVRSMDAEPAWGARLATTVRGDIEGAGDELVGLLADLDSYLRDSNLASGIDEVRLASKSRLRARRRELAELHGSLLEGLQVAGLGGVAPDERPRLPAPLARRDYERRIIRDAAVDAGRTAGDLAASGVDATGDAALRGVDRALRELDARRADDEGLWDRGAQEDG